MNPLLDNTFSTWEGSLQATPILTKWHIPGVVKRTLPNVFISMLREIKGRILTREFSRRGHYQQSAEDALASASMSIIVPVHDAPAVTRRCLKNLEKYAPQSEIIIVDDGSTLLETRDMLRQFSTRNMWTLLRHEMPEGHSVACQAGARLATRPYLCLLNSDTVVTPWCWRLINNVFDGQPKVGIAGPSTSYAGTSQTVPIAAQLRPYLNDNQICALAQQLLHVPPEHVKDLPWISGFAFFIRRALWEALRGFDPMLPDYGNEVELCARAASQGYRNVWVCGAYIHHFGQQSYTEAIGEHGILSRIQAAREYILSKSLSTTSH